MSTYKLILSLLVLAQNKLIDTKHEDDAARGVWNKSQEVEVRKMVRVSVSQTFFLLSLGMCLSPNITKGFRCSIIYLNFNIINSSNLDFIIIY
jgi:hypothetical protein